MAENTGDIEKEMKKDRIFIEDKDAVDGPTWPKHVTPIIAFQGDPDYNTFTDPSKTVVVFRSGWIRNKSVPLGR